MDRQDFRPQGQPPSLEEVVARARERWQGFNRGPFVALIVILALLILFWSAWFTVQPEETGIVQRFGRVVRTAEPGLHFKLPYGIETVRAVPTARVLKEEFGFRTLAPGQRTRHEERPYEDESLMLTGDLNVIDVQWIVQYRIENRVQYIFKFGTRERRSVISPKRLCAGWWETGSAATCLPLPV